MNNEIISFMRVLNCVMVTSEVRKSIPLEVQKMGPLKNYINNNQTNMSNIESNHIVSAGTDNPMRLEDDPMERVSVYENLIKEKAAAHGKADQNDRKCRRSNQPRNPSVSVHSFPHILPLFFAKGRLKHQIEYK